jgi:hypothetical protein
VVFRNYQTKKRILRRSTPQNDIATQARCEEGEIWMIEKGDVAQQISSLMLEVSEQINQSVLLVKNECTTEEFASYRKACAKVMGYILLEVLNPIYAAHPEIKPNELK